MEMEMTGNRYWTLDNPHGWNSEDLESLDRETQTDILEAWFHRNFEDPAENTPHDSSEGGYQWIWGGPHDAEEELQCEFAPLGVSDEVIGEVVEEVTRDGLFLWAPTYDRHEWEDPAAEDWFPLPLDGAVFLYPPEEELSRQNVLERVEALEQRLASLEGNPPVVGSNESPWATERPPFSTDDYSSIVRAAEHIRRQGEAVEPDQDLLNEEASQLKALAVSLGHWLRDRLTAGADAFMKVIGAAAAAALLGLYEELVHVCQAVVHWITRLV